VGKKTIMRPEHPDVDTARPGAGRGHAGCGLVLAIAGKPILQPLTGFWIGHHLEARMGVKKTGKGRRKLGQKKRRMRARIRHRKG